MKIGNKIPIWPPDCKDRDSVLLQAWILNQALVLSFLSQEVQFRKSPGSQNRFLRPDVYGGMVLDTKSILGRVEAV